MVVGEMAVQADLVVIGGGPGGYHAAIRAAQLGRQVFLIEKEDMGGICLNKGCIPSKVLTIAAQRLDESRKAEVFGIESGSGGLDFGRMKDYQAKTIAGLRAGVEALCKANKVQIIRGNAFFLSDNRIGVENGDTYEVYRFRQAIIAAGARPAADEKFREGERVVNQWSISFLPEIPGHLAILGFEPIHLEMAMAYRALGSKVTLIAPEGSGGLPFDSSIEKELLRIFKKEQISFLKECKVLGAEESEDSVLLRLVDGAGEKIIEASHFFYGSSRKPNSNELGLERIGVKLDNAGFVAIDGQCRTSAESIFAIGDITGGPFLASKAIRQGKVAAEVASGGNSVADFRFHPTVAFTRPPIASAGLTETEALAAGHEVKTSQFPLAANGLAGLSGKKDGLVKIVSEQGTDLILGVHIIGEGAHELIFGGVLGLEMAAREEDFIFPSYPHPGLAEAMLEAADGLEGKAIHSKPGKKEQTAAKA